MTTTISNKLIGPSSLVGVLKAWPSANYEAHAYCQKSNSTAGRLPDVGATCQLNYSIYYTFGML